jgi:hypothetical protein
MHRSTEVSFFIFLPPWQIFEAVFEKPLNQIIISKFQNHTMHISSKKVAEKPTFFHFPPQLPTTPSRYLFMNNSYSNIYRYSLKIP